MPDNKLEVCNDCESELTPDNTADFGGFDGGNYLASRGFGNSPDKSIFTKCDSCFEADIDRAMP